jgi:glycerate dehydrogenase
MMWVLTFRTIFINSKSLREFNHMTKRVVVTYEPGPVEKKIYGGILDDLAKIDYLRDVPESDRCRLLLTADVLISLSFSPNEIKAAEISCLKPVQFIQLIYAGADNVPFERIPADCLVASNIGAFAKPIAEHVLALTLALAKQLIPKNDQMRNRKFDRSGFNQELRGGVCGIVGLGGNGREIARTMQAIGMEIYGINRSGTTDIPVDFIGTRTELERVLEASDVVVVTTPLTRETKNLIGEDELGRMKKNAILINVGRGAVINQEALYKRLKAAPEFRAGIDTWWYEPSKNEAFVPDYPFFELPNLIGSPHCADHVPGAIPYATRRALENVRSFLAGQELRGVIKREDYLEFIS